MAYGDGSVYQRGDGRWVAALTIGWTRTGRTKRTTRIRKTEAEAKRALRQMRRDAAAGQTTGTNPRTTLKTWCDQWKDLAAERLRPSAYRAAAGQIDTWIIPTIGHRRLTDLTPADLRALDKAHEQAGNGAYSRRQCRSVLAKVLHDAQAEGYTIPAPVMAAPMPRKGASSRGAIPAADAARLLHASTERDTWAPLPPDATPQQRKARRLATEHDPSRWVAALLQGMRQGECLGLTWDRVDLDAGTITVDRQLQAIAGDVPDWHQAEHLAGQYYLVPTKTSAGLRRLPLVPWMAAALEEWRGRCPESPYGLVWPRPSGGPWSSGDDRLAWRGLQDAAGVHKAGQGTEDDPWAYFVVHEARHSTATLLMAAGVPATVVIAIMGHTAISTTMGYQHADLEQARAALEAVAPRLGLEAA